MKAFLEPPIVHAETVISALVTSNVVARYIGGAFIMSGEKFPIALLTRHDQVTRIFDLSGAEFSAAAFDETYPGKRAAFEERPSS